MAAPGSDPVRTSGGLYVSGNGDVRPLTTAQGVNLTGLTQYHSLAEAGPSQYPGYRDTWRAAFVAGGGWLNLVTELRVYGAKVGPQAFTVEGQAYTVPAPTAAVQLGAPAGPGLVAYDYQQVTTGACDGLLHRLLAALRAVPAGGRVNVQFASEVDTDTQHGYRSGSTLWDKSFAQDRAVDATTYMISWMKDPPNGIAPPPAGITFTMGWAGQAWSGITDYVRCHPDSLPVDYAHWNCYHRNNDIPDDDGPRTAAILRLDETLAYHRACGPTMRAKNIIIGEWGVSKLKAGGQAPYIRAWPEALSTVNAAMAMYRVGQYVMTNYYSARDSTWGTLDPQAPGVAALRDAYGAAPFA